MAIKSPINPQAVLGREYRNINLDSNYISTDSLFGKSGITSAANKIVRFQNPTAHVKPAEVSSIVNTISTNIINNVVSKIQLINTNISKTLGTTIKGLTSNYSEKVKQIDSAQPTSIVQRFIDSYKSAFGFINSFSDIRIIDNLGKNLKALRVSFTESFEVARLIRQIIVKIVKQLSSLPTTTPSGGGGMNVDVKVPGSSVMRSTAPRGLSGMFRGGRGRMLALGAGALGLGAAGAAATNALSGSDAIQPGGAAPEIPGNIVDSLSSIIDRFARAIDSLVKGGSGKTSRSSSGSSSGSAAKPAENGAPGDTSGAPGAPAPNLSSSESEGVIDYAKQKGFSEQFTAGLLTQVSHESGGNPFIYNPDDKGAPSYGIFQFRAERGDLMIKYLEANGIPNAKSIFTNSKDPRRNDKELQKKALSLEIKYFTEDEKDQATAGLRNAQKSTSIEGVHKAFAASERYAGYDNSNSERYRARLADTKTSYTQLVKSGKMRGTSQAAQTQAAPQAPGAPGAPAPGAPQAQAQAAPTPAQAQAAPTTKPQTSQNISQPAQRAPIFIQMPLEVINSGGAQQSQGGGGGGVIPPSTPTRESSSIPMFPAGNPDNFLVLYSRLVYNIVDG